MKKVFGKHYKDIVRNDIMALVKPDMTIFTLPYLNFQIERKAKTVYCCEKNTDTWAQQTKIAPKNCILHNTNASEIVGETAFDLVFLDMCGSISQELFKCLERVRMKNRDSKLIITLLRAREHPIYTKVIAKHGGRTGFIKDRLEQNGFYLYKIIEYMDSSPMMVLFATRRKRKNFEIIKI